tara:strand:+ start:1118 stop:1429 length:312 start_codon:yes stop_codon:yes gene_type:complete
MAIYTNITTGTTTTLITKGSNVSGNIKKISIANVDGHQADDVCLYLEDGSANKFYFFKDLDIPMGTSLVLDDNLSFDSDIYNLKMITQNASDGGTPSLTIIIK